jgi:hypothetical protein
MQQASCCVPPGASRVCAAAQLGRRCLPGKQHLKRVCCFTGRCCASSYAVRRLPAAYRLALAECARRAAWQEMFAGQAALKACLLLTILSDRIFRVHSLHACCRLPAAYRLALAECARRAAWQEMFAGQAARLAEHCGRITAKEASKRESVRRQLERHLPLELLAKAGLLQEPPHCTVSDVLKCLFCCT